jgi:uncharacterized protein (DUF427 family)
MTSQLTTISVYPMPITPVDHVEPVPRRIRAELAGRVVLDTTSAVYLWEWPFYPQYQIPFEDIDPSVVLDEQRTHQLSRGKVATLGLGVGDTVRASAGRRYLVSVVPELVDTVRFDWEALDAWYEEDEPVFVHPRNPYVRVDALRSSRHVRVERDGILLAESASPVLVFETGLPTRYYFDRTAVNFDNLVPSPTVTACPYKGKTTGYWSLRVGEDTIADLAWTYDFPTRQLLPIAGLVAFYDEQVDTFIDAVEQPRPGTHFFKPDRPASSAKASAR